MDVTSLGGQDLIVNGSTEQFQDFCATHFKDQGMLADAKTFVRRDDAKDVAKPTARK